MPIWNNLSPDCVSCTETIPFKRKSMPRGEPVTSQRIMAEADAEVFALRLRLERALADHADVYQQVEVGKRERMLASAEIEGLKKYHSKEMQELQDQLLAQRSVVSKLTMKLQEAMQGGQQATILQDEIKTIRQSHGISMKRLQSQISKQDSQIKSLLAERSSLAAQMEAMQGDLQTATSLADQQGAQAQEVQVDAQAHAEQMHQLQAAHEEELSRVQQAAQLAQADMQAVHAAECSSIKEAHAADLNRLRALQDALPERLMQLQAAEPRQSSDLSPRQLDAMLADRGEVAVNCEELDELRSLAASGSDSAELAQETADLIALLHQARSSNASVSASKHVPEDICTVLSVFSSAATLMARRCAPA
ncbi:hypothetical protein ABBQ38_009254 [Trebouxia sp. C0009 RCD-2024]